MYMLFLTCLINYINPWMFCDRGSEVLPARASWTSDDIWTVQWLVYSSRVRIKYLHCYNPVLKVVSNWFPERNLFNHREKDLTEKLEQFKILFKKLPTENYNNLRWAHCVIFFQKDQRYVTLDKTLLWLSFFLWITVTLHWLACPPVIVIIHSFIPQITKCVVFGDASTTLRMSGIKVVTSNC